MLDQDDFDFCRRADKIVVRDSVGGRQYLMHVKLRDMPTAMYRWNRNKVPPNRTRVPTKLMEVVRKDD